MDSLSRAYLFPSREGDACLISTQKGGSSSSSKPLGCVIIQLKEENWNFTKRMYYVGYMNP